MNSRSKTEQLGKKGVDQLTERVNQRDALAIKEVYQLYFKPCAAIVMRDQGSLEQAREIFQAAIFSLVTKLENPAFEVTNVKGYLYQSCFNLWVKYKKTNRLFVSEELEQYTSKAIDQSALQKDQLIEKEISYRKMYACLAQLKEDCQTLLKLTFFKKYSDAEIAAEMGYKRGFVKNKRQRCMKALRKCMEVNK